MCLAAHVRSFRDGLPDLSNFYCLPGRAGGSLNRLATGRRSEFWNDDEFLELEAQRDDLFAKRRQVVLVAVARFLAEPVRAKPAYDPRHLAAAELREQRAQRFVLHAADGELAAG